MLSQVVCGPMPMYLLICEWLVTYLLLVVPCMTEEERCSPFWHACSPCLWCP